MYAALFVIQFLFLKEIGNEALIIFKRESVQTDRF